MKNLGPPASVIIFYKKTWKTSVGKSRCELPVSKIEYEFPGKVNKFSTFPNANPSRFVDQ